MDTDLLPDFVNGVKELRQKDIKRYPCKSNRASQLGYAVPELQGCLRRGVYERTRWEDKELWDVDSLIRFEEGNRQEQSVLRDLADAGFLCIEQQSSFDWQPFNITGHVDFKIIIGDVAIPVEIKSCSPMIFKQIHTFEDLNKYFWLRAYKCQITLYMLMQNIDMAIFLFKDKSSGLLRQINVPLDYELGEYCIRAAEQINKHVENETLPEHIEDIHVCEHCPYKMICLPDIDFGTPLKIVDDPMFFKRIEEYQAMEQVAKDAKKLYEVIKGSVRAQLDENGKINHVVGDYLISGGLSKAKKLLFKIEKL